MRAAIALLAILPLLCAAQDGAPVPRPTVKAGDRWLYHGTDYRTQKSLGTREERATFVSDAVIHTLVVIFGKDDETDATYTSAWNSVSSFDGGVITPHSGTLRFPMTVGDRYAANFENRRPRRGDFHVTHQRTVHVVGWEDVVVPAGKFRALKLEVRGTYQRHDRSISGKTRSMIWYVPAVRRWAKQTHEDWNERGALNAWYGDELIDFKVQ